MHYNADFCMRHYAGFSQIGSHMAKTYKGKFCNYKIKPSLTGIVLSRKWRRKCSYVCVGKS